MPQGTSLKWPPDCRPAVPQQTGYAPVCAMHVSGRGTYPLPSVPHAARLIKIRYKISIFISALYVTARAACPVVGFRIPAAGFPDNWEFRPKKSSLLIRPSRYVKVKVCAGSPSGSIYSTVCGCFFKHHQQCVFRLSQNAHRPLGSIAYILQRDLLQYTAARLQCIALDQVLFPRDRILSEGFLLPAFAPNK